MKAAMWQERKEIVMVTLETAKEIAATLMEGCVLRKARKEFVCVGDGTPNFKLRKFSSLCAHTIVPGMSYIEFEPLPASSGSRHCMPCAARFFKKGE